MAENYQSKRERWQRQRETFPPALQDVALSMVDSIGALEEPARQLLAEVFLDVESIPKAITLLDIFPDMPADMLLRFANAEKGISWQSIQARKWRAAPALMKARDCPKRDFSSCWMRSGAWKNAPTIPCPLNYCG